MSLKDELLKAKLISKQDLKRIEHEDRVERKKVGREGLDENKKKRQQEVEEKQKAKKQQDREIARDANDQKQEKEQQSRVEHIIKQGAITEGIHGNRKFYFVANNKTIPFLQISEEMAKRLEYGNAAIIEERPGTFVLVNQNSAEQIRNQHPAMVCFFNK